MRLIDYFSAGNLQECQSRFYPALTEWVTRQGRNAASGDISIAVTAKGAIAMQVLNCLGTPLELRSLRRGDADMLKRFKYELSSRSRELFSPYPWEDTAALKPALEAAIAKSVEHRDAGFIILHEECPIGHFFLWHADGNAHSLRHGVDIPELGVAVSDRYQGRGLGFLSVRLLQLLAQGLDKDAVELTTAVTNDAGWNVYLRAGFEDVGMIRNPLDVDVVAAAEGTVRPTRFREERQMVYIINRHKQNRIMSYLEEKRKNFAKQSGDGYAKSS